MTDVVLSLAELVGVVLFAVVLAVTDGATLSRVLLAALAKRVGVDPEGVPTTSSDGTTDGATDGTADSGGEAA